LGLPSPPFAFPPAGDEVLFTLKLKANAAANLSNILNINSRRTNVEAYSLQNEVMGVQLSFGSKAVEDRAALYQNTPNPFTDETQIGFYLPSATRAVLTVRDVKGALIYKVEGNYTKGNNQVTLKKEQLRASGVMYYTLETSEFTATKKLVLLNR
jgi:large repetitive protein